MRLPKILVLIIVWHAVLSQNHLLEAQLKELGAHDEQEMTRALHAEKEEEEREENALLQTELQTARRWRTAQKQALGRMSVLLRTLCALQKVGGLLPRIMSLLLGLTSEASADGEMAAPPSGVPAAVRLSAMQAHLTGSSGGGEDARAAVASGVEELLAMGLVHRQEGDGGDALLSVPAELLSR